MPVKICNFSGCNKLISFDKVYCNDHERDKTSRHIEYDKTRRNSKSKLFYNSTEWIKIRSFILNKYKYIDLYLYYVEGIVALASTVHHIEELRDNWNKRLDTSNLIPVAEATHNKIHGLYNSKKEETQRLLHELIERWTKEMGGGL